MGPFRLRPTSRRTASGVVPGSLRTVWLFGEHDFPDVEINNRESIDVAALPVTDQTRQLIVDWLTVAGFESGRSAEERLAAGVRAATAVAHDLPSSVRVNFAMRLPDNAADDTLGDWISLDMHRLP